MKYEKHSDQQKLLALDIYKTHSLKETSNLTGIKCSTIRYWVATCDRPKLVIQPQTLNHRVSKIKFYLLKKYKCLTLSTKQAFDSIGTFKRGRELGYELNTERLPTLSINDVARYIVLYT